MHPSRRSLTALALLAAMSTTLAVHAATHAPQTAAATPATPHAGEQKPPRPSTLHGEELLKLIPPSVFFRGQTATVQTRNAGGVRFSDGATMFAVKVDTGGYASSLQEKYQVYLVTEVPLRFGEHALPAGAYGVGFTSEGFLAMDLGGHTLFTLPSTSDSALRRPNPLQILSDAGGAYRLYGGKTYVSFSRSEAAQ